MRRRSRSWWRRRGRPIVIGVGLGLSVALAVWLARPSWASDFGIIPQSTLDETAPSHRPKLFKGPKIWREGPPRVRDLQTSAVKLWDDVKTGQQQLIDEGPPS